MMPETKRPFVAILLIILVVLVLGWLAFRFQTFKTSEGLTREQSERLAEVLAATPAPLSASQEGRLDEILNQPKPELSQAEKLRLSEVLGN